MYHVNNRETLLPKFIVVFSVVIWFLTETLSVFHALTSNNIRLIWTVIGIVCLGSLVGILKRFDINVRAILRWIRKYILEIARGQWLELILISAFFVLAAVMIYKIMRKLEVGRSIGLFSALLFMMCPLAIAESVTTQTDLIATMWIVIFAYFILALGQSSLPLLHGKNIINVVFCACSVGFGWLTKSSVCFMMPLLLVWLFIVCLFKKEKWSAIIRCTLLAAGIIIILALPGFIRNYKSTGNIFAYEQMAGNLLVKTANPKFLFLNACKNLTLEMAGTKEPDPVWGGTIKLADMMKVDIEDPEISAYPGFAEGRSCTKSYHHDLAGAKGFMIILCLAVICEIARLLIGWRKRRENANIIEKTYIYVALCSGIAMFICIRWQPWGNRLLLPALSFFSLFIGFIISKLSKNRCIEISLIVLILLFLLPDTYGSVKKQAKDYAKPVWNGEERFDLYFVHRNYYTEAYKEIINEISLAEVAEIGLLLGGDTYEYPLWVALKDENTEIHPVVLENSDVIWRPEYIIAIDRGIGEGEYIIYGRSRYECIWNFENDSNYAILKLKI